MAVTGFADGKLVTVCLSLGDGRELWRHTAPAQKIENTHRIGSPAAPTPCTDGQRLYVSFGSFGLLAYDWNGALVWQKPLPPPVVEFGTGASPILAGGKLILVADQDVGAYLAAFSPSTGDELWRVDRSEFRRSFSTPFVWRHSKGEELIVPGSIWLRSYDLETGKQLWSVRGMARVANASPASEGDLLFVSSWNIGGDEDDRVEMEPFTSFASAHDKNGDNLLTLDEFPPGKVRERFSQMDADKDGRVTPQEYEFMRGMFARATNQLFAIRAGGRGDITDSHVVWQTSKQLPYVSSPLVYKGRVFTMKNGGLFSCYEAATGKTVYQGQRVAAEGDYYSSAAVAADKIYLPSQRGVVLVLNAASDQLDVLARNDLKAPIFASPAIVDGTLYLRTDKHILAFSSEGRSK
jgi:outer membrane protein assembly factor BamB